MSGYHYGTLTEEDLHQLEEAEALKSWQAGHEEGLSEGLARGQADRDFYLLQAEAAREALASLLRQLEWHGHELEHAAVEIMPWYQEAKQKEAAIHRALVEKEIANR